MSTNEINEMFSYITKENKASMDKIRQLFTTVFKGIKLKQTTADTLTRSQFETVFNKMMKQQTIEQDLLYLFYQIDQDKKGYLNPQDVMGMFHLMGHHIDYHQVQNSFKYAKVSKNKMTFLEFKDYFYNF